MCFDNNGKEVPSLPRKVNLSSCNKLKSNEDKWEACVDKIIKNGPFLGPQCSAGNHSFTISGKRIDWK